MMLTIQPVPYPTVQEPQGEEGGQSLGFCRTGQGKHEGHGSGRMQYSKVYTTVVRRG